MSNGRACKVDMNKKRTRSKQTRSKRIRSSSRTNRNSSRTGAAARRSRGNGARRSAPRDHKRRGTRSVSRRPFQESLARREEDQQTSRRLAEESRQSGAAHCSASGWNIFRRTCWRHDRGKLASGATKLFGLELEGMSPEDQEFEVARRFVRLAASQRRMLKNSRRERRHQRLQSGPNQGRAPSRAGLLRRRRGGGEDGWDRT